MVSIVIPVYNVETYLSECIDSVLQLKTPMEILLVDDGSTDTSGLQCDQWQMKDRRIRAFHQTNSGLSEARNTGIRNARGEFILFLDSDDVLDPTETDAMLEEATPETNVMMGLYQTFYSNDAQRENEKCQTIFNLHGTVPIEDFLTSVMADTDRFYMVAWRFVVRRNFLLENDLFFFPGIYHEDEEWTQRLVCCSSKILITHHFFYQYRQGRKEAITSQVTLKHMLDIFNIIEEAYKLCEAQPDDSVKELYLTRRMAMLYFDNMLHVNSLFKQDRLMVINKLINLHDTCITYMSGAVGFITQKCDQMLGLRITCSLLYQINRIKKAILKV